MSDENEKSTMLSDHIPYCSGIGNIQSFKISCNIKFGFENQYFSADCSGNLSGNYKATFHMNFIWTHLVRSSPTAGARKVFWPEDYFQLEGSSQLHSQKIERRIELMVKEIFSHVDKKVFL